MGVSIPCEEIGGGCTEPIQGSSLDEMVEVATAHAVTTHGLSKSASKETEVLAEIRSAIPQTSRPSEFRSVNFTFI
ncbi:DUF1059 domain-containing protein [Candidatus Lucifugimonas marina]|uniref:DUF1059 domain-containing protein n=1 Tax=Candidatus Lucifugimonas marina TaxID=3038979 RepID=A0AAJ6CQX1_9CHLR|nr:DUF1059 domain-containing protein [SAR202 cluster bacterium JH702]MDG0870892.1 DUF1059 domain-containing protein [SAR202 cluster bacterium JH639]WFG34767.1 DUF1059 domain-containing protein [SAR202 cluster bacterium JH545]WFG38706.1 DUF1059 domain-containing protein [SAR202 cluster bacterium JH1073]